MCLYYVPGVKMEAEGTFETSLSSQKISVFFPPQKDHIKCLSRYRVILSVLDPRKCEYLKDYSLDFEHAYMTTYLAS